MLRDIKPIGGPQSWSREIFNVTRKKLSYWENVIYTCLHILYTILRSGGNGNTSGENKKIRQKVI